MTDFYTQVVKLTAIEPHPNADRLDIATVFENYKVIVKRGEYKAGDLAIYISPDALLPLTDPRFSFLLPEPKRKAEATDEEWAARLARYEQEKTGLFRLRCMKLRGVFSMGLIVPIEPGMVEGQDVMELLKLEKYEPDADNSRLVRKSGGGGSDGDCEPDDPRIPWYPDTESIRRRQPFEEGEIVRLTEKLHGSCSSYTYLDGRLKVCSRTRTRRRPGKPTWKDIARYYTILAQWAVLHVLGNIMPKALREKTGFYTPRRPTWPREVKTCKWWKVAIDLDLETKLKSYPELVVFGEVYAAA